MVYLDYDIVLLLKKYKLINNDDIQKSIDNDFMNENYKAINFYLTHNIYPTQKVINELTLNNKYLIVIRLVNKGLLPDKKYIDYAAKNNYKYITEALIKSNK